MNLAVALASTGFAVTAFATVTDRFDYLKQYDVPPAQWTREIPPPGATARAPIGVDLGGYYKDFRAAGTVNVFYGMGYQAYSAGAGQTVYQMLQQVASHEGLPLGNWSVDSASTLIGFQNTKTGVKFQITVGHERDAYQAAFADNEIVMYHGHSRYGRGPAFDSFTNYFRLGDIFPTIEVDTRNPYFQSEPMQLTNQYKPQRVTLGAKRYWYQYLGQKTESSYLPDDAYTKNIPGGDVDMRNTTFASGKQMLWLYSCSNIDYFKEPLRDRFPDPQEKIIFGTSLESYWSEAPAAVFLASVATEVADTATIVAAENATKDCASCFTAY